MIHPLLPLGFAALAVWAFSGKASAKSETLTPKGQEAMAAAKRKDYQDAIVKALQSRDAATIRALVKELRRVKLTKQAADLEKSWAQLLELAKQKKAQSLPAKPAPAAAPATKTAPKVAPKAAPAKKPAKKSDVILATHNAPMSTAELVRIDLMSAPPRQENQALVEKFQKEQGLGADGLYGTGTARKLWAATAKTPPEPRYYSKKNPEKDRRDYLAWLKTIEANA